MTLKAHRGRCAHCGHDHDAARKMAEYRAAAAATQPQSPAPQAEAAEPVDEVVERAAFVAEAKRRGWKPGEFMLGAYAGWLAAKMTTAAPLPSQRQEAAQAVDQLRAEVERLTLLVSQGDEGRKEAAHAEAYYRQAEAMLTTNERELHAQIDALRASRPDVEKVMALADEWVVEAIHAALSANSGHDTLADPDAARSALRAELEGSGL